MCSLQRHQPATVCDELTSTLRATVDLSPRRRSLEGFRRTDIGNGRLLDTGFDTIEILGVAQTLGDQPINQSIHTAPDLNKSTNPHSKVRVRPSHRLQMRLQISLNKEVQEHAVHLSLSYVDKLLLNSVSKSDGTRQDAQRCDTNMRSSSTHITVPISKIAAVFTGLLRLTSTWYGVRRNDEINKYNTAWFIHY